MRALALRNVCRGVGGAIYQATVPQELFPVLLAVARGNVLIGSKITPQTQVAEEGPTSPFFGGKTSLDSEIIIGSVKRPYRKEWVHIWFLANLSMNRN
jgi:hypothetical protein